MVFVVTLVGLTVTALAHTLPGRFLLDAMAGDRAVWHMPRAEPATIYLTFDDGPNPSTTPALLDVLEGEGVSATFFLIDAHVTSETAPPVRRWFRRRTSESIVTRIAPRATAGDIIVLHDGDESAPRKDQRHTVEATARLIPLLRARGFGFGTVCRNDDGGQGAGQA